jgi:hypothetical protein
MTAMLMRIVQFDVDGERIESQAEGVYAIIVQLTHIVK